MKGILKRDFKFLDITGESGKIDISECDEDFFIELYEGEVYDIIKVFSDHSYISGTAFVLFDPKSGQVLSVDSGFVKVLQPESNKWEAYWNQ